MRKDTMMRNAAVFNALARCAAAGALACGLMLGCLAVPQPALADTEAGRSTTVHANESNSIVTVKGGVRLTKQSSTTALVELTNADEVHTVDVGLEARSADGTAVPGASFAFSPEAEALATHHVVQTGAELRVVVSSTSDALAPKAEFTLGTITLPEGATKVAVTRFTQVSSSGSESSSASTAADELIMTEGTSTNPGGNTSTNPGTNPGGNTSTNPGTNPGGNTNTNTNTSTNTDPGGNTNTDPSTNTSGPQNTSDASGNGTGNAGGGSAGGGGNGGNGGNGGTSSGGKLPQTGDDQLLDASAMLLIGGAAALVGGAVLFLRRTTRK